MNQQNNRMPDGIVRRFLAALLLLSAFLSAPAFAGFTYHVIQPASSAAGSKERYFSYYVPSNYAAGTASPLYVVLHGCRIDDRAMTDLAGFETFAERDRAIVLYPFQNNDASSNDNDGRNPNCWGFWMDGNIHRDAGEVGDIKRMVDYMKNRFTVDNNRVHITGISSGGAMATIAQVAYPDVFASSVMVEGVGYGETAAVYTGTTDCKMVLDYNMGSVNPTQTTIDKMRAEMKKSVLRQPPVMVIHNKKDCTVPMKVGQAIIDTFRGLLGAEGKAISATPTSTTSGAVDGFNYTWSKYGKDASGNSLVEAFILDVSEQQVLNAGVQVVTTDPYDASGSSNTAVKEDTKRGHWWSGAPQRGPWTLNKGPKTSQIAADFFKAHPMSGGGTTTTTSSSSSTSSSSTTSTAASTTTTPSTTTTTAGACYRASNYAHVSGGRAYNSLGTVKANGSNQNMGMYNTYTITKLRKTGNNYYVIDSTCP